MRREEIDRLLARLTSGEITPAERAALYQAALDDETLFEEIFAEQALAEALADEQLRDEFLLRESVRDELETAGEDLEPALASSPRLHEVRDAIGDAGPVPLRPEKRRIPWWGWAVPAAVAASTVLFLLILPEPVREPAVSQRVQNKFAEWARAKPEQPAPQAMRPHASPPAAPSSSVKLPVDKSKQTVAESVLRKEAVAPSQGKSEEGAAGRGKPGAQDLKDQPAKEKENEVASAAPAPRPPAMIRTTVAAEAGTPARRADEADARQTPAQVAEFRVTEAKKAAAPAAGMQNRAAVEESRGRVSALAMSPKLTVVERESAIALVRAAILQAQDASGDWLAVARGGRVARNQRLRVKLTPAESGSWQLPGPDGRSVALAAGQTGFLDLPAYTPGAHVLDLTFQPAEPTPVGVRADAVRPPLGRVMISFVVE